MNRNYLFEHDYHRHRFYTDGLSVNNYVFENYYRPLQVLENVKSGKCDNSGRQFQIFTLVVGLKLCSYIVIHFHFFLKFKSLKMTENIYEIIKISLRK